MTLAQFEPGQVEGVAEGLDANFARVLSDLFSGYSGGPPADFVSGSSYVVGNLARSGSGYVYICTANVSNTTLDPANDAAHWSVMVFAITASPGGSPSGGTNTVRYGQGAPSNSVGNNNDFYIDIVANFIYGPKAANVWPDGTSLVGPQGVAGVAGAQGPAGPAGTSGNTVRYGTGAPQGSLGNDGDFYISVDTHYLYGPRAGGVWPAPVSIVGPQGPQGPAGVQGPQGATGAQGASGPQGAIGPSGSNGNTILYGTGVPANTVGNNGDFYIADDIWFIFGPKANGAWPVGGESIVGPPGPGGGDGSGLLSGNGPPTSSVGVAGDFYIDTQAYYLYGPKEGVTWPAGVSLIGPQGVQGAAGAQGSQGPQGPAGATGAAGTGVPPGGTTGQVLTKNSNSSYDTGWQTPSSLQNQNANTILAGPASGSPAPPAYRALVSADLPAGLVQTTSQNSFANVQAITPAYGTVSGSVVLDLNALASSTGVSWTETPPAASNNIVLVASGNVTSLELEGGVDGAVYNLYLVENGTGGFTWPTITSVTGAVSFGSAGQPTLTTTANAINQLSIQYLAGLSIYRGAGNAG